MPSAETHPEPDGPPSRGSGEKSPPGSRTNPRVDVVVKSELGASPASSPLTWHALLGSVVAVAGTLAWVSVVGSAIMVLRLKGEAARGVGRRAHAR